ncbi:MFS transporter [Streptomyces sp. SGAir0957]
MLAVLRHRTYRRLFAAQVVALVGTGLATVALGLLAYDLAGADAGAVLGTALAVKMTAYVAVAPVVGAFADRLPRRALLVGADLVRAGVAAALPFVDRVGQVYVLVFVLQSASAVFTPAFQALVPEVLPDARAYTRALSLARLAYDMESLFSPALAAALLSVLSYNRLFLGTMAGFLVSAALVVSVALPRAASAPGSSGARRATSGVRLFLTVPALRSLLALNLAVAAASAMVTVNTVVYVREFLGLSAALVPVALGAYGDGSMVVALALPRLLERVGDRTVMLRGALLLAAVFVALGAVTVAGGGAWQAAGLLVTWCAFGAAGSMVLTPTGRLVRRAAPERARTAAFAAQFSLSHACWLLTYPLAGVVGAAAGLAWAVLVLGTVTLGAAVLAVRLWPAGGAEIGAVRAREGVGPDPGQTGPVHDHIGLDPDHPHLRGAVRVANGWRHSHRQALDGLHPARP